MAPFNFDPNLQQIFGSLFPGMTNTPQVGDSPTGPSTQAAPATGSDPTQGIMQQAITNAQQATSPLDGMIENLQQQVMQKVSQNFPSGQFKPQNPNMFLPNSGFFGNHPNLSRGIEQGMMSAAMTQPSQTPGQGVTNVANALLNAPGAYKQAQFQRTMQPLEQQMQALSPVMQMRQQQLQAQQTAMGTQKTAAEIGYMGSESEWREAQSRYFNARGDYYDQLYGKNQWEPYPYPMKGKDGQPHPAVIDKNTGKLVISEDTIEDAKPVAARPWQNMPQGEQAIHDDIVKRLGVFPGQLDPKKAAIERAKSRTNIAMQNAGIRQDLHDGAGMSASDVQKAQLAELQKDIDAKSKSPGATVGDPETLMEIQRLKQQQQDILTGARTKAAKGPGGPFPANVDPKNTGGPAYPPGYTPSSN